ncbi:hypothetical protein CHU92_00795 [Flavobacterium cyanobacteriorum]|uniref:Uncharacterized protein n=1 Tax=Flavobacterium cyanobacteriorum TaxID=2022802 RepID=A0A256A552_9FLAO|nr:hypothetical protein [Flavobacterium cyanobacteriorum]OYQ48234.1 hypothetical protein CHU92_00795 [Flavobacterium cyanobacteriorum]
MKHFIKISFYSFAAFCTISYMSVMTVLLSRRNMPTLKIGFPLEYYTQFWVSSTELHWGWNRKNFFIDVVLTAAVVAIIYLFVRQKKKDVST